MRKICCIAFLFLFFYELSIAQPEALNSQQFFLDDRVINVTLTTDIKKLRTTKKVPVYQPANIGMQFPDSTVINEEIRIQQRGNNRKIVCDMASLMLNFKNIASPKLSPLRKLKLVGGCQSGSINEELLLKEYLVYKIYNLISNMSFRVRLLHINYQDSKQKARPYIQYGFLIEDMKDMTARNNCVEIKNLNLSSETTNRQQITLVALFQYMIGNTDWSVPKCHNIKLIAPKNDTLATPYAVAYDFDYAGLVDAPYAVPPEILGNLSVKERVYRGFPRTEEELNLALDIFRQKKDVIFYAISSFPLLRTKAKNEMIGYMEEFYEMINNKRTVKSVFINNARTE